MKRPYRYMSLIELYEEVEKLQSRKAELLHTILDARKELTDIQNELSKALSIQDKRSTEYVDELNKQ